MARRIPTQEEIDALVAAGWRHTPANPDEYDWFWPPETLGYGWTYTQAVKEQRRRDKAAKEVVE